MIVIRFSDSESERRALGYLAGRFPFTTHAAGETLIPEVALPYLASEGIQFIVQGPATYEHRVPTLRNPPPASI